MSLNNTWKNVTIDEKIIGIIDTVADDKITDPLNQIDIKEVEKLYIISLEDQENLNIYKKVEWTIPKDNNDSEEIKCSYDPRNKTVYIVIGDRSELGNVSNLFKNFVNTTKIIGLERCPLENASFDEGETEKTVFLNCNSLEELSLPTPKNGKTLNDQIANLKNLKRLSVDGECELNSSHNLYLYSSADKEWKKVEESFTGRKTLIDGNIVNKNTFITHKKISQIAKLVRQKESTNIWYDIQELIDSFNA